MTGLTRTLGPSGWAVSLDNPATLQPSISGLNGIAFGASGSAKQHPEWLMNGATYSRTGGLAGCNTTTDGDFWVGMQIDVCHNLYPDIEGTFTLTSVQHIGGPKMTLTWADPRYDIPQGAVTSQGQIHDQSRWSNAIPVLALAGMFGFPIDWTVIASGGTNLQHWVTGSRFARIKAAIAAQRPDVFWFQSGLIGNDLGGNGVSAATAKADLYKLLDVACPNSGLVLVEGPPANRNYLATTSNYAAAFNAIYNIAREVTSRYPNAVFLPVSDTQAVRYGPTGTDQDNAYPPAERFLDNAHEADGGSMDKARWAARIMAGRLAPIRLLGLNKPEDVTRGTNTDADGLKVKNVRRTWFAPTTVSATAPATGLMPKGCRIDVTNPGTVSSVVSSVPANHVAGNDWRIDVVDNGTTADLKVVMAETCVDGSDTANALLAQFNLAANQGKKVRVNFGWALRGFAEGSVRYVSARLVAVSGGLTFVLTGLDDCGTDALSANSKYICEGRAGDMPCPVFTMPAATYTSVELQLVVKAVAATACSFTAVFDGKTQVIIEG